MFHISVENPDKMMKGVKEIWLDGQKVEKIPAMEAGSEHQVRVVIGKADIQGQNEEASDLE